jgi:pyruvate ferredoxin oxidoreductase gamma subunit
MYEVRLHGRGGQGVVTAAEILSVAAFREGRYAQAFPSFGSERMGAPVMAFCRLDERPIRLREPVTHPDALIVLDATLLHQVDVFAGLGPGGIVLINSARTPAELALDDLAGRIGPERVLTVPATDLAREHIGRPIPNAVMLGAFAAADGRISLASLEEALREEFPPAVAEANIAGARAAHAAVGALTGAAHA